MDAVTIKLNGLTISEVKRHEYINTYHIGSILHLFWTAVCCCCCSSLLSLAVVSGVVNSYTAVTNVSVEEKRASA